MLWAWGASASAERALQTKTTLFTGRIGTGSVAMGGDLFSTSSIVVGDNGSSGTLSVVGGTVETATYLQIGGSTTLAAGGDDITSGGTMQVATATIFNGLGAVTVGAAGLLKIDATGFAAGTPGLVLGSGAGATGTLDVNGGTVIAGVVWRCFRDRRSW
jgi:hypothetical protein